MAAPLRAVWHRASSISQVPSRTSCVKARSPPQCSSARRHPAQDRWCVQGARAPIQRPRRPGACGAEASVASCARSVTHLRDAFPRVLVGSLAPAVEAASWRRRPPGRTTADRIRAMAAPITTMTFRALDREDPDVADLIRKEYKRQSETLELIASENLASPAVLAALATLLTNKYAEGYPGRRYYGGPGAALAPL